MASRKSLNINKEGRKRNKSQKDNDTDDTEKDTRGPTKAAGICLIILVFVVLMRNEISNFKKLKLGFIQNLN